MIRLRSDGTWVKRKVTNPANEAYIREHFRDQIIEADLDSLQVRVGSRVLRPGGVDDSGGNEDSDGDAEDESGNADEEDQDTSASGGNSDHGNSRPICELTGTCGSASSSGASSSSGSSSGSGGSSSGGTASSSSGSSSSSSGGTSSGSTSGGAVQGPSCNIASAQRTVTVTNSGQLQAALANAQAGDHIVLANGTYSGNFTATRGGAAGRPVIIRSQNLLGATLTSPISLRAQYIILQGIDFTGGGAISLSASNTAAFRNRLRNPSTEGGIITISGGITDWRVAYNEGIGWKRRGIYVSMGGASGPFPTRGRIDHNYMHNMDPIGHGSNGGYAIGLGTDRAETNKRTNSQVDHNLVVDVPADESTMSKSSGTTWLQNTLINSDWMNNRHGSYNKYISNWIENSKGINVTGRETEVIGNKFINASQGIRIKAGTIDPEAYATFRTASSTPRAIDAKIIANGNVRVLVGERQGVAGQATLPALRTLIRDHQGTVQLEFHEGTIDQRTQAAGVNFPAPVKMTPAMVGPAAPCE